MQNKQITQFVYEILNGDDKSHFLIQAEIYHIFKINKNQISHIQNILYGISFKRIKTENSIDA